MILVRESWYETPGSPDLPFTLNRSMAFPSVFKLWDLYVVFICHCMSIQRIFLINNFSCKEKPERSTGKLGGESWLQEHSKVARDF